MNGMVLRPSRVLLSGLFALVLSGCSIMHAQSRIDPRTVASYQSKRLPTGDCSPAFDGKHGGDANSGVVNLDCATFPGTTGTTAYELASTTTDPELRRQFRNRLGGLLMKHADDSCIASLGRAANNEAVSNTVLSTLTTALSAASTVVTGDLAKSILSGSAATTSGARDSINAEIFRNTLISAIAKAINAERDKISTEIDGKLKQSTAEYDVDTMIRDINRYHQACSYVKGLELVTKAVDRSALCNATEQVRRFDLAIDSLAAEQSRPGVDQEALTRQKTELVQQRASIQATGGCQPIPSAAPPVEPADGNR